MIALLLCCSCGVGNGPPNPAEPFRFTEFGVAEDLHYDQQKIDPMIARITSMGLHWVRLQVLWDLVQSDGPDVYRWDVYDTAIAKLHAHGIHAIGVLDGTPAWARSPGCTADACTPADPAAFGRFAAAAAARYQADDVAWEVWNEPNVVSAWAPGPDARAYVALLADAARAIRAVAPGTTVVSGGLSPAGTEPGVSVEPTEFLSQMYAAGVEPWFDALGWHPYADPRTFGTVDPAGGWSPMADTPVSARSIMESNGDGRKRIWATEFGLSTAPGEYSEQEQADLLVKAVRTWARFGFAGPLIIYNYRDREPVGPPNSLYGLVRSDDVPKPALERVSSAVHELAGDVPASN